MHVGQRQTGCDLTELWSSATNVQYLAVFKLYVLFTIQYLAHHMHGLIIRSREPALSQKVNAASGVYQ